MPSVPFSGTISERLVCIGENYRKGGSAMGILKRLAFYMGLLLGLTTIAAMASVAKLVDAVRPVPNVPTIPAAWPVWPMRT